MTEGSRIIRENRKKRQDPEELRQQRVRFSEGVGKEVGDREGEEEAVCETDQWA